jgi:hypothetical protein
MNDDDDLDAFDLDDWELFDPTPDPEAQEAEREHGDGCDCIMCTLHDYEPRKRSAEIIPLPVRRPPPAPLLDKNEQFAVTLCFMGMGLREITDTFKARGIDDGRSIIYVWNPAAFRSATLLEAMRAAQSGTWLYRKFATCRERDHFMWRHSQLEPVLSFTINGNYPDPPAQLALPGFEPIAAERDERKVAG